MIRIHISEEDIEKAKRITARFDSQKTNDKFAYKGNWIGVLGEMKLKEYFEYIGLKHEWLDFVKPISSEPDFIVDGSSYDLKTQTTTYLALTSFHFDYYVYARINRDYYDMLYVIGIISKKKLERMVKSGKLERMPGLLEHWKVEIKHLESFEKWMKNITERQN